MLRIIGSELSEEYLRAKQTIIDLGYLEDITWAENLQYVTPHPQYVVRETAWVILNSGFRNTVANKLWPALTQAFHGWEPMAISMDGSCVYNGMKVLRHEGKLEAMQFIATYVANNGIEGILEEAKDPPRLTHLPWIGKITCWHLAKLLGADVIKPDVHINRCAKAAGYPDAFSLCKAIQDLTRERLTVIDSVLWRFCERGWGFPPQKRSGALMARQIFLTWDAFIRRPLVACYQPKL